MQYEQTHAAVVPARRFTTVQSRQGQATAPQRRVRDILDGLRWGRRSVDVPVVTTIADLAECGCPDWCHRDHENE
ncbi:MAG: hypothetical protein E6J50_07105 [Chloroflexi bacterium]|nr:MAG: hypothetical protein E6J50_07105 [Chloroflexota bacterium]